jgi:hypothetical protein
VIKKSIGNPLYFGVQNRGFLLAPEVIICGSLCDQYRRQRVASFVVSKLRRGVYTPHGFSSFLGHQGLRGNLEAVLKP